MAVKFIHDGDAIDYTPGADVTAGDVVVQGELVGVAKRDIVANQLGALAVKGVFDFPKASGGGSAIAVGADVYWDVAEAVAKTDDEAGANKLIDKTVLAATDDEYGLRVQAEVMDFLITANDLVFYSVKTLPLVGDQIRVNRNSQTEVFEVMDLAGQGHWKFSDAFGKTLRIHTKHIATE